MIISAHISYNDHLAEIGFPMDDDSLDVLLSANKMPTDTTLPFLVEDIHFPEELSCLNGEYVNLDEMNYLAKRIDSFTEAEMEQFGVAVEKTDAKCLKDLINLTFNLNKFTIHHIESLSNSISINVARTYIIKSLLCCFD